MNIAQTELLAEWDLDHHIVYGMKRTGWDGPVRSAGQERPKDARTVWLPVVRELPDGYMATRHDLLGASQYRLSDDGEAVIESFPDADYSPEAFLKAVEQDILKVEDEALRESDRYVVDALELGQPVPKEIRDARAAIRTAARTEIDRLGNISPSEWLDYTPGQVLRAKRDQEETIKGRGRR